LVGPAVAKRQQVERHRLPSTDHPLRRQRLLGLPAVEDECSRADRVLLLHRYLLLLLDGRRRTVGRERRSGVLLPRTNRRRGAGDRARPRTRASPLRDSAGITPGFAGFNASPVRGCYSAYHTLWACAYRLPGVVGMPASIVCLTGQSENLLGMCAMNAGRRRLELGLLPTAPIGSHALPAIYLMALERIRAGEIGESDLREALEDASQLAILDQERAGLDLVSDGEVRRHGFILSFYGRLTGLRDVPPARRLGP